MMKACAAAGIPVVVLDRPNPLGGEVVEGNLQEPELLSFVGLYPVPVRHGMTPGEIARWVNAEHGLGCDLTVVPMRTARGVPSRREIAETPAWVLPSPNMPTPETARVYPGGCLVEGTNLSEGRGTTRPFELVGAPWLRRRRGGRRSERARPARRRLPAARLQAHVPEARGKDLRRRAGARDGPRRLPALRDVSAPAEGSSTTSIRNAFAGGPRTTSTATTSRRSTS